MRRKEIHMPGKYSQEKVLDILMKFRPPLIVALVTIMVSTIGYMVISGEDLLKAFYMAVLTVTTIGYGEMWDMGVKGRLFNIIVMTFGVGSVMGYSIAVLINIVTSGEVKQIVRFRKMVSDISSLKNHYVILGLTDYVKFLVKELKMKGIPFVVVSNSENLKEFVKDFGVEYSLNLDPSDENTLMLANVENAVGAIVTSDNDYKNLAITLTVRKITEKLAFGKFFIFSVVNSSSFKQKLFDVGADYVEAVPEITSKRIAAIAENPPVFGRKSFLEEVLFGEESFVEIEEFLIDRESPVVGKSIYELGLKEKFKALVIGVKKRNGSVIYVPSGEVIMESGDILLVTFPKGSKDRIVRVFAKSGVLSGKVILRKMMKERENGLG